MAAPRPENIIFVLGEPKLRRPDSVSVKVGGGAYTYAQIDPLAKDGGGHFFGDVDARLCRVPYGERTEPRNPDGDARVQVGCRHGVYTIAEHRRDSTGSAHHAGDLRSSARNGVPGIKVGGGDFAR
jgi:hypothetical protein